MKRVPVLPVPLALLPGLVLAGQDCACRQQIVQSI